MILKVIHAFISRSSQTSVLKLIIIWLSYRQILGGPFYCDTVYVWYVIISILYEQDYWPVPFLPSSCWEGASEPVSTTVAWRQRRRPRRSLCLCGRVRTCRRQRLCADVNIAPCWIADDTASRITSLLYFTGCLVNKKDDLKKNSMQALRLQATSSWALFTGTQCLQSLPVETLSRKADFKWSAA